MYAPMARGERPDLRRADAVRDRARILEAARFLLAQSPSATPAEIAAAAGASRSTLYRRLADREELVAALEERPQDTALAGRDDPLPPGRLGRDRPVELDAIHVFDVVAPPALPEQLVAEAERITEVPVALYVGVRYIWSTAPATSSQWRRSTWRPETCCS